MGAALIILILVGAGEMADPSTSPLRSALEKTARRPVAVAVREIAVVPDEAESAWIAADAKVDVVVEVGWSSPAHQHATVHLHGRDGRVLRASELDFAPTEPGAERGRAVGFAIATMLADEPVAAGIVASTAAAVAREQAAIAPVAAPAPSVTAQPPSPTTTTGASVAIPRDRVAAEDEGYSRFAVEGAGSASADARGNATGGGPLLRLQWNVARDLGLRVGGSARWFTASGVASSELGGSAGALWTFARSAVLAAGLRVEGGVARDAFTERTAATTNPRGKVIPGQSVARGGWAPMFLAGVEGDWRASRALAVFVAVDVEASTRSIVAESQAAPSPVWGSLESGTRISF
ncbi:MAG: hypothetical protein JWO86_9095 [Myxococcaceae bacterium]|nr:hypothetical protein [Myxococcaceae bacterium]